MSKILIVEDDHFLRNLLVKKLSENGYEVEQADTGEKGVEIVPEAKPDLIVLDLLLPGMHGFDVLAWLKKQDKEIADIPVIILSNLGSEEDIDKGNKLGATDFLIKAKFTPQEILEKVSSFIKK